MEERILCFDADLQSQLPPSPVTTFDPTVLSTFWRSAKPIPRSLAEKNFSLKQFVVYGIIRSRGQVLAYYRTRRAGEERLRGQRSIGVGGHVNAGDASQRGLDEGTHPVEFFGRAFWREVQEEIRLVGRPIGSAEPLLFINDNSDEVGRVHFGLVYRLDLDQPLAELRQGPGLGGLAFLSRHEAEQGIDEFEGWSRLLLSHDEVWVQ